MNILINHLLFVYASQDLKILFRRERGKTLEAFLNLSSKVEPSNLSPKPHKVILSTGCIAAEAQGRQLGCPFHRHSSDLAAWADPWNTQFGAPSDALGGMFSSPKSCLEFSCHISYCKHPVSNHSPEDSLRKECYSRPLNILFSTENFLLLLPC